MKLTIYPLGGARTSFEIIPAPNRMPRSASRIERCEAFRVATGSAWWVVAAEAFGVETDAGEVAVHDLPFVLRTSPGWSVLVRGPANHPHPSGLVALEHLVECDKTFVQAQAAWRATRSGTSYFAWGEPIVALVPVRRGDLESVKVRWGDFAGIKEEFDRWESAVSTADIAKGNSTHRRTLSRIR